MPIFGEVAAKVVDWLAGEKKPVTDKVDIKLEDKELKKYQNWIKLANKKHKDDVEKNAKKFLDRLKQKFPAMTDDEVQVVFNYYKSNLSRIIPSLVPKEIKAKIKPAQGKDQIPSADGQTVFDNRRASIILNNKIDKILQDKAFKYAIRAAANDIFLANLGTIVVGYEMDLDTKQAVDPEMQAVLDTKAANGEVVPGETPGTDTQVIGIEKSPKLTLKRESWRNVKVDPKATDYFFGNKRYAVRVVRKPLDEAKALYGEIEQTEVDEESKDEFSKMDEAKMAVFYELYDYTDGVRRLTFIGEGVRLVGDVKLNYDPLASCKLNYLPDEVYPPADMTYYESLVDEANFYRTVKLNQISRGAARKVLAAENTIDTDDEDKLMSAKDMELITVKVKQGEVISNKVFVQEMGAISSDLYNGQQTSAQDIQEMSSVSATRLGQVPNAPATNATLANNAYESGMAEKADILKDWMIQIVERVIEVLKEISVEKENMVIERSDGTTETITWSNEDIALANVEVDLDITADEPTDSKLARMQAFINFITQPQIASQLASDGYKVQMFEFVKEMGGYYIPDKNFDRLIVKSDLLVSPDKENILMMAGQPVQSQPQENFKEHLDAHKGILQLPIMQQMPEVIPVIQAHIAQTEAMMAEQEKLKQAAVPPVQQAGPVQSQMRQTAAQ